MKYTKHQEQGTNFPYHEMYQTISKSFDDRSSGCYVCRFLAYFWAGHIQEVHGVQPNVCGKKDESSKLPFHVPVDRNDIPAAWQQFRECVEALRDAKALQQHIFSRHSGHPVIELKEGDDEYDAKKREFLENWTVDPPDPGSDTLRVDQILKVNNDLNGRAEIFERYKAELIALRGDKRAGKESLVFHGTTFVCNNYRRSHGWELCGDPGGNCGVCGTIEHGLKLCKAKQPHHSFQRFGRGIYCTPISSKSDNYVTQYRYKRAIFVCKVFLGVTYEATTGMENLDKPPEGYDSVWGRAGSGTRNPLRYDEYVVYNSSAILPTHLIIYHKQLEADHNCRRC